MSIVHGLKDNGKELWSQGVLMSAKSWGKGVDTDTVNCQGTMLRHEIALVGYIFVFLSFNKTGLTDKCTNILV